MSGVGERAAELAARRVPFVHARVVLAETTDQRPAGRRGARPRRRDDGGLRRRRVRRGHGACPGARRARLGRTGRAADQRRGRGTAGRQGDGAQPLPQRRHAGDLPRTASPAATDGRRRRWADRPGAARASAQTVGFEVVERRRARARRPRRRLARPETKPPRWAPRCRPASTTSGWWRARSAGPSVVASAGRRRRRADRHSGRVGHRRPHAGGGRAVDLRRRDRPAPSTLGPAGSRGDLTAERRDRDRPGVRDARSPPSSPRCTSTTTAGGTGSAGPAACGPSPPSRIDTRAP